MIKTAFLILLVAIGIMCTNLVVISVIHDLSDGKIDGTQYVNGCTPEGK